MQVLFISVRFDLTRFDFIDIKYYSSLELPKWEAVGGEQGEYSENISLQNLQHLS